MEKRCRTRRMVNLDENIEQSPSGISMIPEEGKNVWNNSFCFHYYLEICLLINLWTWNFLCFNFLGYPTKSFSSKVAKHKAKILREHCPSHQLFFMFVSFVDVVTLSKTNTLIDLPIPNEIIDNIFTYLSSVDLLNLSVVGNERLRDCSYKLLRKNPLGN